MTSDLQIASNRDNARKSTGPRTPEGKARVAKNGVTHGLTGRFQMLPGESPDILDNLLTRLTVEHCPAGETESFLVRQLAELQLRLGRVASLESELMRAVVDPDAPVVTPNAILARTFLQDCTFDVALLRLNRYEGSLRRSHIAALRELRQQQKSRRDRLPVVNQNQSSVAEVMKELALDRAKAPSGMHASAAPDSLDKANPLWNDPSFGNPPSKHTQAARVEPDSL